MIPLVGGPAAGRRIPCSGLYYRVMIPAELEPPSVFFQKTVSVHDTIVDTITYKLVEFQFDGCRHQVYLAPRCDLMDELIKGYRRQ